MDYSRCSNNDFSDFSRRVIILVFLLLQILLYIYILDLTILKL